MYGPAGRGTGFNGPTLNSSPERMSSVVFHTPVIGIAFQHQSFSIVKRIIEVVGDCQLGLLLGVVFGILFFSVDQPRRRDEQTEWREE